MRLGTLPKTRKWRDVISLLENSNSSAAAIATASFNASIKGLENAPNDAGLLHSFLLLTRLVSLAKGDNFIPGLRQAGLHISDEASLLDITAAFTRAVDAHLQEKRERTDIAEMAIMSATETITDIVGEQTESLFGTTKDDIQRAFRSLSTNKQFGILSREFFSRFTQRYLEYFVSRELSNHVGGDRRFKNIEAHTEFSKALRLHCHQTTEILERFSGGWFSKNNYENAGEIPETAALGYIHYAFEKLRSELKARNRWDGPDE